MTGLIANPEFWQVAIGIIGLVAGYFARPYIKVPTPANPANPTPVPAPAPTPTLPDGLAGLAGILALLKTLAERKQHAEALASLEELKQHAPSTVLPKEATVTAGS